MNPRALIAEDEPLLAQALCAGLARAWPELSVLASVGDGVLAVREALALRPDVLFLDIRMPGLDGLQAAARLADAWPAENPGVPFPALVFVTAYDHYAVRAFEAQAADYLLKPVQPARLQKTVEKLRQTLAQHRNAAINSGALLAQAAERLRCLLDAAAPAATSATASAAPLHVIQAGVGDDIRIVPLADVLCLQAADKYLRVLTAGREYLIRTPLKDLQPRLDPGEFWQVHRSTVVRAAAIDSVRRDAQGRLALTLRGRPEFWPVSRLHAHRFKAM